MKRYLTMTQYTCFPVDQLTRSRVRLDCTYDEIKAVWLAEDAKAIDALLVDSKALKGLAVHMDERCTLTELKTEILSLLTGVKIKPVAFDLYIGKRGAWALVVVGTDLTVRPYAEARTVLESAKTVVSTPVSAESRQRTVQLACFKLRMCLEHARDWSRSSWQEGSAEERREHRRVSREAMQDARYWRDRLADTQ